jgi:hypothetical protein
MPPKAKLKPEEKIKPTIKYVEGDLFQAISAPSPEIQLIIPHVCNDIGAWGAGFVVPLGKRYPIAQNSYHCWHGGQDTDPAKVSYSPDARFRLGRVQIVHYLESHQDHLVHVCNMIAQHGLGPGRVLRYNSLALCMESVAHHVKNYCAKPQIHAPAFGSGLAGGNWSFIEELVNDCWIDREIPVTIYFLSGQDPRK